MIYYSNFGSVASQFGALVYKDGTGSQLQGILTWQAEGYDQTGWHDTSSNTSRLTVPSGVSLIRLTSNILSPSDNDPRLSHLKNGADFRGMGHADTFNIGNHFVNITTAPIAVTAGDYFQTILGLSTGTATIINDEETWASVELLDPATKYALVYKSAAQAIGSGANTILTFDSEVVDTNTFHDTVTNNTRLTVPSGVSLVRLSANVESDAVSGQMQVNIIKNGASARGLPSGDTDTANAEHVNVVSAPIVVSPGDYFEIEVFFTNATNVTNTESVWASIEEVPATRKYALVNKSGNQSITAPNSTVLTWDQEVVDAHAMHDNSTNNSRLTVPSGCTRACPSFSIRGSNVTGQLYAGVKKNGSDFFGMPAHDTATAGTDSVSAMGPWVDVTPGDYFEVYVVTASNMTIGTDDQCWFCLECQ